MLISNCSRIKFDAISKPVFTSLSNIYIIGMAVGIKLLIYKSGHNHEEMEDLL
jgi:hypothetical protein